MSKRTVTLLDIVCLCFGLLACEVLIAWHLTLGLLEWCFIEWVVTTLLGV